MNSWKLTRLGELGTLYDGPHATPTRRQEGKYFLNIASLDSGRLDLSQSDHVDDGDFERWTKRVQPQENDLLFSYETRLGEAALMPGGVDACLGRRMALLRPSADVVIPKFLLYAWLSPWFKGQIERKSIRGATVDRIPLTDLADWSLRLPDREQQRAIGEVLGALDDKIAANGRLANLIHRLQETAWRRASTGSREVKLTSVAPPLLGGTPSRSDESAWGGGIPWASVRDLTAAPNRIVLETAETISVEASESARRLHCLPVGSVVLSARGTVGHVITLGLAAAINQSSYAFEAPEGKGVALRLGIESIVGDLQKRAHGSVFSTITMKTLGDASIPDLFGPDTEKLSETLELLERRRIIAMKENLRLAATRDELLPLLMSGKITVKDAEKTVEEVV